MQEEQSRQLQLLYEQYYDTIFRYCQVIVHYQPQYNPFPPGQQVEGRMVSRDPKED